MAFDFHSYNIVALAPEVVLALFAMAVLIAGAFFEEQRRFVPVLALAGVIASAVAVCALWGKGLFFGPSDTAIYAIDDFSLVFKAVFLMALGGTILMSGRFLDARTGDRHTVSGEFYALLMLSTIGMMMVASARDLLVVFLGIETFSIALYVLAGFARARLMSNEAALKYFLLGAFATGFLLYGIALTYAATGTTLLPRLAQGAMDPAGASGDFVKSPFLLHIGMALLLIGLGFKAALVPFHQWTPDVYEGSPTPITAFMAVGAKAAAFAALLRVFPGAFGTQGTEELWHGLVLVMAVLTMTVGNIVAIAQTSLKRMLAYSSIAHAGYLLIGVVAAGNALQFGKIEAASDAQGSVIFYLIVYALMNLGAFGVLTYLESAREDGGADSEDANLTITDLKGVASRNPLAAAALSLFLISLAGIPPTAGFFAKLFVFTEAMHQGLYGLLIVAVLNTVISVYFYLRPIVVMCLSGEREGLGGVQVSADGAVAARATSALSLAVVTMIALCAAGVLAMFVLQVPILGWVAQAVKAPVGH